ncbi:Gypsy retrotransposon integrase-like protein 1 [Stygiomarasmius scandens]|uniref:Gypsy retrotransposon integrase-like protein 1 n=1 Tax=Marasmiellus scandens TaxID=2682957 RepID=A0ABR1JSF1_9AGAR
MVNEPSLPNDDDSDSSYSETEALSKQVANLNLKRVQNRHFGKSSAILFVTTTLLGQGHNADTVQRRPEFWVSSAYELEKAYQEQWPIYEFPDDDLLRDLMNLYFTFHHPYHPLLHQSTFEKSVSQGLHLRDHEFGSVVIALCSVASRYSDDPRNLPESSSSTLALGWKWFRQLERTRSSFVDPATLYELQTYCLSSHFLQTTNLFDSSWILTGLSIHFAQERGVHRRNNPTEKPSLERELWKRAFWQLLAQDLVVGIALGRPRATTTDEYDTEALIECDESEWDDPNKASLKMSPGSISAFLNCYMRLLEVAAFCHRSLYSVRTSEFSGKLGADPQWNEKAVREVDSALNEWIESVPSHLKWDAHSTNNVVLTQSAMLYSVYYWIQIQAHRTFIPKPGEKSNVNFPSLAICLNAARSCVHVVDVQHKRHSFHNISIILPLFSSALMILLSIFRAKELRLQIDSQKEMVNVYKCIEILRDWEKRNIVAGRFSDILSALVSSSSLKLPLETPGPARTLKRGRDTGSTVSASTTSGSSSLETSEGTPSDSDWSSQSVEDQLQNLPVYGNLTQHVVTDWHSLNIPNAARTGIGESLDPLSASYYQPLPFDLPLYDDGEGSAEMASMGAANQQDWDVFMTNLDQFFGWGTS